MTVVPLTDEGNHSLNSVLSLVCKKKRSPLRWTQQKESTKKAAGGMIKLYGAVDKYVGPLVWLLFVIMAERAHYVTLQLRLAALLVI